MLQSAGAVKDESYITQLFDGDDLEFAIAASRKKNADDDDEDIDDDFENEEDEEDYPLEIEPTEKDIFEDDFPLDNPEEDLLDDDDEIPYN
jgi:hypothetical protein